MVEACGCGSDGVAAVLLRNGADPSAKGPDGGTAWSALQRHTTDNSNSSSSNSNTNNNIDGDEKAKNSTSSIVNSFLGEILRAISEDDVSRLTQFISGGCFDGHNGFMIPGDAEGKGKVDLVEFARDLKCVECEGILVDLNATKKMKMKMKKKKKRRKSRAGSAASGTNTSTDTTGSSSSSSSYTPPSPLLTSITQSLTLESEYQKILSQLEEDLSTSREMIAVGGGQALVSRIRMLNDGKVHGGEERDEIGRSCRNIISKLVSEYGFDRSDLLDRDPSTPTITSTIFDPVHTMQEFTDLAHAESVHEALTKNVSSLREKIEELSVNLQRAEHEIDQRGLTGALRHFRAVREDLKELHWQIGVVVGKEGRLRKLLGFAERGGEDSYSDSDIDSDAEYQYDPRSPQRGDDDRVIARTEDNEQSIFWRILDVFFGINSIYRPVSEELLSKAKEEDGVGE